MMAVFGSGSLSTQLPIKPVEPVAPTIEEPVAPTVKVDKYENVSATPVETPTDETPEFNGGIVPLDPPTVEIPVTPKEVEIAEVAYKLDSVPKEVANTPVYSTTLPNTGEKEGIASTLGLVVIAAGIAGLTLSFKKYNEGEE